MRLPPGVPGSWWARAEEKLAHSPRTRGPGAWRLDNPERGLKASFSEAGYALSPSDTAKQGPWSWSLTVKALGREGAMLPLRVVPP